MNAYSTPRWAQVILWFGILTGLLGVATLFARAPVHIDCGPWLYPQVKCEATNIFPSDAHFTTYIDEVRGDYEKGSVVYLTLPDNVWVRIEVRVEKELFVFYGTFLNRKPYFRKN